MFNKIKNFFLKKKANMNEVRFKYQYVYGTITYGVTLLLLVVMAIFSLINAVKFAIVLAVLLGVIVVGLIVYFCFEIKVKKQEVIVEGDKLIAFFEEKTPEQLYTMYSIPTNFGEAILEFEEDKVVLNGVKLEYKDLNCALYTSNFMHQVGLIAFFQIKRNVAPGTPLKTGEITAFSLRYDKNLEEIMKAHKLFFENSSVLEFMKEQPYEASKQVLKYGRVQDAYYIQKSK